MHYLKDEEYTFDKGKWYVTSCFIKSNKKNNKKELKYGFLNNEDYNNYLINSKKEILSKIPLRSIRSMLARFKLKREIHQLKRAICK